MKTMWTLQDAKHQFGKVVEHALHDGPQYVTRKGVATVVIISIKEFETLHGNKPDFKEFLLSCPKIDEPSIFERQRDFPRSIEL